MSEQNPQPNEATLNETAHGHAEAGHGHEPQVSKLMIPVAVTIILLLAIYGAMLWKGLPQEWTRLANEPAHHEETHDAAAHTQDASHTEDAVKTDVGTAEQTTEAAAVTPPAETAETAATETAPAKPEEHAPAQTAGPKHPPYYMIAPFAILLLCIAILPLIPATEHWWESNTNRFLVAAVLGFITLCYYAFACNFPVDLHWPAHAVVDPAAVGGFEVAKTVFINAIVADYIPFIVLLFSLFTISGGIRISGDLKASPFVNSVILFIGAVLASFVGTTGAAMLLIRLLLETNQQRKYKVHTVVIFIFCVCNCGGCLTPLGDPPLFLGYLKGVAFSWTFALWKEWIFVNMLLIGFYFLWDTLWFYRREPKERLEADNAEQTGLKITGLGLNLPLLIGVVLAVAFLAPGKPLPGTNWYPFYFLREAVQLGLCALSLLLGSKVIRKENSFNFLAIGEVAALFFGIFICMQAPLQILNYEGKNLGIDTPSKFFWATGSLSSVLDNAPTYVVFFETAKSLSPNTEAELKADPKYKEHYEKGEMVPVTGGYIDHHFLVAIALGAVFMGAMTYIGNGPNFMVKAIAEQSGVKMPSFFGYIGYSCLILLPLLIIMNFLFL